MTDQITQLERQLAEARAEIEKLREAALDTLASLVAAISLLERGGKAAKKGAPSDRMFDLMILDYKKSVKRARAAIQGEPA